MTVLTRFNDSFDRFEQKWLKTKEGERRDSFNSFNVKQQKGAEMTVLSSFVRKSRRPAHRSGHPSLLVNVISGGPRGEEKTAVLIIFSSFNTFFPWRVRPAGTVFPVKSG